MTEEAKKATFEVAVYEEECHLEGRRLSRSKITALIDAEFAEVIKERDALKKALGELVTSGKVIQAILRDAALDYDNEIVSPNEYEAAITTLNEDLNAAEKLLEPQIDKFETGEIAP